VPVAAAADRIRARFDVASLEHDPSSTVLLDPSGKIVWANEAWYAFFDANGGGGDRATVREGSDYLASIRGRLQEFYGEVFATCLETGLPFEHDYECSSATEVRSYRLRVLPVDGQLLVSHTKRAARPRETAPEAAVDVASLARDDGQIVQCSNCRRLRGKGDGAWQAVPEVLERPPAHVTHGLCPDCAALYHGALGHDP
jgi:hypothetical protein